jgi:DNA-binding NtrC family response regulator
MTVRETSQHVLIVEDDTTQRSDLAEMVAGLGLQAATAGNGWEALAMLESSPASVILTDLMMPGMDSFELLRQLAARGDSTPAIVLTGFGRIEHAISIVHDLKAFWFLEKPVQSGVLRTLLDRAIRHKSFVEETERFSRQLSYQGVLGDLVGRSAKMMGIFSLIRQVILRGDEER